ncbi:MAG: rhodanese-like domain-containing protein [Oscillibacter sp.]
MKQLLLLALVIIVGVVVLRMYSGSKPSTPAYQTLTAEEAKARLDSGDSLVLLDVRTREEYAGGHIPTAVCLPNEEIGQDVSMLLPDFNAEILVYCRSGRRSKKAAAKLAKLGYTKVCDFGGINNWTYETTTE